MALWKGLKEYAQDDAGMGTVEVILIIVEISTRNVEYIKYIR